MNKNEGKFKIKLVFFIYSNVSMFLVGYIGNRYNYNIYPLENNELLFIFEFTFTILVCGLFGVIITKKSINIENCWFSGLISLCLGIVGLVVGSVIY